MTIVTYEEFGKNAARMFNAAVAESYKDLLEKAVAEAVAAEREACLAEFQFGRSNAEIKAAIRARGNK
jgi:hypothetical protein